ncbi:MAG TPA: M1 family aminopeptidase, partial [Anaerolineales bacterium]|nr:M1 family aminopeptidase [Anaerolineales bacterium]
AADALALYDELYGPYPYQRLAVVQGDFPDGMEFSGLVFVGRAWFKAWQDVPNDWLTVITAHEVAHQWWYASVGNDQGINPYLDEMLSIYSELLFLEHTYPEFVDWWWAWRIEAYQPEGYVDATVYEFYSIRSYINAVYLRGALMMKALRAEIGDSVFLAWLKDYADQMRGKVATPADFWGALPTAAYNATTEIRQHYLRYPDILAKVSAADMP